MNLRVGLALFGTGLVLAAVIIGLRAHQAREDTARCVTVSDGYSTTICHGDGEVWTTSSGVSR